MIRRWSWIAATCLSLVAGAACAADQAPYGSGDPTAALPPPPTTSTPLQTPVTPPAASSQTEATLFVLAGVRFDGARAVSEAALREAWSPMLGRPVSLGDLRRIGRQAELIYAATGYPFVAVILTPQDVQGGQVTFRVVEGHISDLTVLGLDPIARRQVSGAFQPLVGVTPLAIADVESAYEMARSIPGLSLAGTLRRGSEPGGMDLVIQTRRRTWRAYANVNNFTAEPVGPWGVLLGVDYNGASQFGDRTSLQVYATADLGEQTLVKLDHVRTLNHVGTMLEVQAVRAWASPRAAVAPLDLATDVTALNVELTQPLYAHGPATLRGHIGLDSTNQETRVFSSIRLTRDDLRIAAVGLTGAWRGAGVQAVANLEYRQGLSFAGASRTGDPDLSRFDANPQAGVLRGDLTADLALPARFALNVRAQAQWSNASLAAPEEFTAGNLTIGRGYDPGAAFGDSALAAAVELRGPPLPVSTGLTAQPFVFHDAAEVWNHEPGAPDGRWIRSAGAGVRLEATGRFQLVVTYAAPLDPPLGFGEPRPSDRLLVNLTVGLPDAFRGFGHMLQRGARP